MPNEYYNRVTDFVPDTAVRSSDMDSELNAVVAGFDKLGDPTKISNGAALIGVDSGAADNIVFDNGSGSSQVVDGQLITLVPAATNTGSTQISYNGGDNVTIVRNDGSALQPGDLIDGVPTMMIWDEAGQRWVLVGATSAQTAETLRPAVIVEGSQARILGIVDENAVIVCTNASPVTITAPSESTEALPVGFLCHIHQGAAGTVTIQPDAGVVLQAAVSLAARTQYSSLSIIKTAANTYKVLGDMATA